MIRRIFQGIAHHQDGDFINVSEWVGHPANLFPHMDDAAADKWVSKTFGGSFGGILGLPEILFDSDLWVGKMCAKWGEICSRDDECKLKINDKCNPPRVKFKATVEIERLDNTTQGEACLSQGKQSS